MKNFNLHNLLKKCVLTLLCLSMGVALYATDKNGKTRVGVFDGHGGSQTCIWEAVAAIQIDPDMTVRTFTTADIANGVLKQLDAIIIPGGGG